MTSVNIIVAVGYYVEGKGWPIGKDGKIPWHNQNDLKWFKEITMGHPVIMGRKTWESLKEPLKGRTNIVITKHFPFTSPIGVIVDASLEEAIESAKLIDDEIFIIGGASIYQQALENDYVDKIYIDFINKECKDADAFFPNTFFHSQCDIRPKWEVSTERKEIEKNMAYAMELLRVRGNNNNVDEQYINLVNDIITNGEIKDTRAGKTHSVFSRQLRFNLKEGLPMLTTKKIFSKGVIHELLWFIKGDTNIKYLIDNNVHIWDDDAYRYYLELVKKENEWTEGMFIENKDGSVEKIQPIIPFDKNTFLKYVKLNATHEFSHLPKNEEYIYGDLNNVYGYQWTKWGGHNQIQEVIDTLKNNPDDRRMIISAWNVEDIPQMALPPCHFCCQFYTKKMTLEERQNWVREKRGEDVGENIELLDEWNVPTRKLSCCLHMRSNDVGCGTSFNWLSYALLTHMIAQCVDMDVDELIYEVGDAHIYNNHIEPLKEQLKRNPHMYALPTLQLNPNIKNLFDFTYDDIKIVGYKSYPPIKLALNVGL